MPTLAERDRYARRVMELRSLTESLSDAGTKAAVGELIAAYDRLVVECDRIAAIKSHLVDTWPFGTEGKRVDDVSGAITSEETLSRK